MVLHIKRILCVVNLFQLKRIESSGFNPFYVIERYICQCFLVFF